METDRDSEREWGWWGLWCVSVFGRHCFGLSRCGSLKQSCDPRCTLFRCLERRDAHSFLSTLSNIHRVHAQVHNLFPEFVRPCAANKACSVKSGPIQFMWISRGLFINLSALPLHKETMTNPLCTTREECVTLHADLIYKCLPVFPGSDMVERQSAVLLASQAVNSLSTPQ